MYIIYLKLKFYNICYLFVQNILFEWTCILFKILFLYIFCLLLRVCIRIRTTISKACMATLKLLNYFFMIYYLCKILYVFILWSCINWHQFLPKSPENIWFNLQWEVKMHMLLTVQNASKQLSGTAYLKPVWNLFLLTHQ